MFGADQLIAHLVGDYLLQTDHMASEKTKSTAVAFLHAFSYSIPFFFLLPSVEAWIVIVWTHAFIDRYRVARVIVWAKNQLAPKKYRYPYALSEWHGYQPDKPAWLAGWLFIIADNVLHITINGLALEFL